MSKEIKLKYKEEDFVDRFSSPCFGNFVPPEKARKQQQELQAVEGTNEGCKVKSKSEEIAYYELPSN